MSAPAVIAVAITGSVPRKKDNPALPVTVPEQVESTQAAFEAGATLVHVHVRNADESSSSDPDKFAAFQEGVRRHCPGMIVQFSTGGRGRELAARGAPLVHKPDMASLATGSVNFPTIVYENPPAFVRDLATTMRDLGIKPEIEVFDLAMLTNTKMLVDEGLILPPPHVQFVFGVKHALPPREDILDFELALMGKLLPGASWTAAGIGKDQFTVARWALARGGHVRTGLEDNIRLDRNTLAPSNAALVARTAELCAEAGRPVATVAQARAILGLPPHATTQGNAA